MGKLYLVIGALLMLVYLTVEAKGMVFSGTDSNPGAYKASSRRTGSGSGRRSGGGGIFWGSGYRGGK